MNCITYLMQYDAALRAMFKYVAAAKDGIMV